MKFRKQYATRLLGDLPPMPENALIFASVETLSHQQMLDIIQQVNRDSGNRDLAASTSAQHMWNGLMHSACAYFTYSG